MADYLPTIINYYGCVFNSNNAVTLIDNRIVGKKELSTFGNQFDAKVIRGGGIIGISSDLPGLTQKKKGKK
ncbi:MAG: hypothetical protein KA206_00795 [Paludibacter sp.]|nr:hypothetical protein [Paludibacter sp.]